MSILALLGFQAVLWTPTSYNKEILISLLVFVSTQTLHHIFIFLVDLLLKSDVLIFSNSV